MVERPDRRSVKDAKRLVLKNVKYITETMIRYQSHKAEETLSTLKNALKISDITGGCGVDYFMNKWNELERKYQ